MNARVIKRFKDKETGEIRNVGDVFECTKARFEEILAVGDLVEEVELPKKRTTGKKSEAKAGSKAETKAGAKPEAKEGAAE